MKNKITHFLLMTSFLISAISCSVDEQELSTSNLSTPVDAVSNHTRFHQYTAQEKQQLRRNLIGTYLNRSRVVLVINQTSIKYYLTESQASPLHFLNYNIEFFHSSEPRVVISQAGGIPLYFSIICANSNPTRILRLERTVYYGIKESLRK